MSERPGRYERSTAGLIGALLVSLLVIAAFVGFRALNRNDASRPVPTVPANQVSTLAKAARDDGLVAPLPLPVPTDWRITSISYRPGETPSWHVGMLTDEDQYVGIEERSASVAEMVTTYVDDDAVKGDVVDLEGREWQSWTDAGGDYALTYREGQVTYLVGGSASEADVLATVKSINLAP